MKKIIFIIAFAAMTTGAFFFYNTRTIADDKDGKCCTGECPKTENCQKECKTECDVKGNKSSSGEKNECPYMTGKGNTNLKGSECPYKSGTEYKHEGTKKSGSCPYMKKETEVKI